MRQDSQVFDAVVNIIIEWMDTGLKFFALENTSGILDRLKVSSITYLSNNYPKAHPRARSIIVHVWALLL
jgi:hypothetical protein